MLLIIYPLIIKVFNWYIYFDYFFGKGAKWGKKRYVYLGCVAIARQIYVKRRRIWEKEKEYGKRKKDMEREKYYNWANIWEKYRWRHTILSINK